MCEVKPVSDFQNAPSESQDRRKFFMEKWFSKKDMTREALRSLIHPRMPTDLVNYGFERGWTAQFSGDGEELTMIFSDSRCIQIACDGERAERLSAFMQELWKDNVQESVISFTHKALQNELSRVSCRVRRAFSVDC